jgi:hypothetical protein
MRSNSNARVFHPVLPPPIRRSVFRQVDVTRAIKGAKAAGVEPGQVEIRPDGTIVVVPRVTHESVVNNDLLQWERKYRAVKA